jgi:hypothetical protein
MSRNFIVYQSRNRATGTLCQTLDTKHVKSDIAFDAKRGRYAARCVEHNKTVFFAEHYPAGRAIAHPAEWCKKCEKLFDAGKRVANKATMLTGEETAKAGRDDMRNSSVNNAADKRWKSRGIKRDVSKETQRKVDAEGTYLNPIEVDAEVVS